MLARSIGSCDRAAFSSLTQSTGPLNLNVRADHQNTDLVLHDLSPRSRDLWHHPTRCAWHLDGALTLQARIHSSTSAFSVLADRAGSSSRPLSCVACSARPASSSAPMRIARAWNRRRRSAAGSRRSYGRAMASCLDAGPPSARGLRRQATPAATSGGLANSRSGSPCLRSLLALRPDRLHVHRLACMLLGRVAPRRMSD